MAIKAVILDFDGVILESCDIKTRAFRELFKDYPKHVDEIVNYHLTHGGVSRYKKFIYFYENILKQPVNDEELQRLGNQFSSLVLEEVKSCHFVPGAQEFLKKYSTRIKLFVASGTPEQELRFIVKERRLDSYFKGVYGTPPTKSEIIERILAEESLNRDEVIFVGDSETDYLAATQTRIRFVAREAVSNNFNNDNNQGFEVVEDLEALDNLLSKQRIFNQN
ncbi:MAG: HAD family hydrolase [Candidatus Hodarchaeales archaeon]|jgi:HAD superfamily hydrolase (TIGR01549 family)